MMERMRFTAFLSLGSPLDPLAADEEPGDENREGGDDAEERREAAQHGGDLGHDVIPFVSFWCI